MSARKVTQAVIDAICERVCDGESLRSICSDAAMPDRRNVLRALAGNDEWGKQFALAQAQRLEAWADDIIHTASTPRLGKKTKITGKGKTKTTEVTEGDMVDRSRLEVDAKKWILSKLAPKKYGDKLDVSVDAKVQAAVVYEANIPPRKPA